MWWSLLVGKRFRGALVASFCLFVCVCEINGCGIMLHTDIGERAANYFNLVSEGIDYNELLRRHPDALQAGSPYPDSFYSGLCYDGIYHQVSEDTHWTPFLNATVNYIRRVYQRPWDLLTQKLVVFLLGIANHQIADVTWHSLGIEQGFLDTMGKLNYHGSFSEAHSDGDVGGDILTLFETDTSFIGVVDQWYVPTEDLFHIYEDLYGTPDRMSREVIENCSMILFLGRLGESLGALELLYPPLARNSPFILDQFDGYFSGGVDDMAVWAGNLWTRTVTMLDQGTSACDLPNNPIYIRCDDETDRNFDRKTEHLAAADTRLKFDRNMRRRSNSPLFFGENDIVKKRTDRGLYLSAGEHVQQLIHKKLESAVPYECNGTCESPAAFYTTEHSYSRLGKSVISGDLNGDGFADVVISAPGFSVPGNYHVGRVYIVFGGVNGVPDSDSLIENLADITLTGEAPNGRFGASVAIVDFNADGLNDLVVSAPWIGSGDLLYQGQVYVFLNDEETGLPSTPSITIDCTERYCNFGFTLESEDLNNDGFKDLIIGSPFAPSGGSQRGFVGVFYADSNHQSGERLTESDLDWRHSGSQNYEWFGYAVHGGIIDDESVLLVGAPAYRICFLPGCDYSSNDIQSVGRIFFFRSLVPVQAIEGQAEFEQFGFSLRVSTWNGQNVAAISSVSGSGDGEDSVQLGVVKLFEVSLNGIESGPLAVLDGERQFSRFGSSIVFFNSPIDGNSNLVITAPYRSENLRTDRESGKVFLYQDVTAGQQPSRVFGIVEDKARVGSSIAVVASRSRVQLVVGANHYTYATGARLGGAVVIYDL